MPDYSVVESLCKELNITIPELLAGKIKDSESNKDSDSNSVYTEEQVALLLYKIQQMENKNRIHFDMSSDKLMEKGTIIGSVLAMIISYAHWQSIGWAILHGLMSWGYVIYYLIRY